MRKEYINLFYFKALCVGLSLSLIYWLFETCIHLFVFHASASFIKELLPTDENELWMRIFTAFLFMLLTLILSFFIRKKMDLVDRLRLSEEALRVIREGCVITNHRNEIIYVNPRYEEISGYTFNEVRGKNPNVLSSGKQDKSFYQNLWATLSQNGFWEGEIWNRNKSGELYAEWISISGIKNTKGKILYHVGIFSDITSQKKIDDKIKHYAYYDVVTALPNRRLFIERLYYAIQIAKRKQEKIAVLFLDLDQFKLINDKLGHVLGDQFLCEVANRIKNSLRESDTVSRFGGDEFVLSLLNIHSKENAVLTAKKLLSCFDKNGIEIDTHLFRARASIGIAIYPDDSPNADNLIAYADQAMYQVKKKGGHNVST